MVRCRASRYKKIINDTLSVVSMIIIIIVTCNGVLAALPCTSTVGGLCPSHWAWPCRSASPSASASLCNQASVQPYRLSDLCGCAPTW